MKIVFLMPQSFPYGIAYSSRAQNFCRALLSKGHEVDIICDYLSDERYKLQDNIGKFEDTRFFYLHEKRNKTDRVLVPSQISHALEKYIQTEQPDLIISSSAYDRFPKILKVARRYKIPIILESCEKYDASNWRFGKLDYRYFQFHRCWNRFYPKVDGVIVISRFLDNFYKSCNLKTLRVPTILDIQNTESRLACTDMPQVTFCFAGTLGGGKDRLAEFILAMHEVETNEKRTPILNIYGPSRQQVENQLGDKSKVLEALGNRVNFFGRISQEKVAAAVRASDFSLVLRPVRESSNAGFPTKLAESMAVGTPVIANLTGDVGLYVEDGHNGIICETESLANVSCTLKRVLNLSNIELESMRSAARRKAVESFDFRAYAEQLNVFIHDVVNGGSRDGI